MSTEPTTALTDALIALIPMATAHLETRRKAEQAIYGEPLPPHVLAELADLEQRLVRARDALEAAR